MLYLDLDGVVQHENVRWDRRRGIYMAEPGHLLFQWLPQLENALAPFPQVGLVLSSSWCVWPGYGKTLKMLPASLRDRFVGGTYHQLKHGSDPHIKEAFLAMPRGAQVCADVLRRRPAQWLAIDDDTQNWPEWARGNLVACDGSTGLSSPLVQAELHAQLRWCVLELRKDAARRSPEVASSLSAGETGPQRS